MFATSVHNTTQNSSDNLPSYLQTNIIAQMLSIGGEGGASAGLDALRPLRPTAHIIGNV